MLRFTSFFIYVSFFPLRSNSVHHALCNCCISSVLSNLWHDMFLVFPCFSWPCQFKKFLARHILDCSSIWISWCFLMIRLVLWIWGEERHRDAEQFSLGDSRGYLLSAWLITGDNLGRLDTVLSARFFHYIGIFSILYSLEVSH